MIVFKTVNDYIDDLCEMYPSIKKEDIKRICNFGWKSLYLLNSYGGDVIIDNSKLWCYFGNLHTNSLNHFKYYIKKLALKFRVLYNRRKIEWDGYYYFGLNDTLYEEYKSLINTRGRKKKWFTFHDVFLYKILDECKIKLYACKHIFRVAYPVELGLHLYKPEFKTDKAELIITRENPKFSDILISNNKYELL